MAKNKSSVSKKAVAKKMNKTVSKSASQKASRTVSKQAMPKQKAKSSKTQTSSKMTKAARVKPVAVKTKSPKAMPKKASTPTTGKTSGKLSVMAAPTKNKKLNFTNFLTPLENRLFVILKKEQKERMTAGGLIIPDTVNSNVESYLRGQVVAVGPGRKDKKGKLHPVSVQIGETVMFTRYAGTEMKFEDESFSFVRESDIVGIVE